MKMTEEVHSPTSPSSEAPGSYVKVLYKSEIRKFKIIDYTRPYDDVISFVQDQFEVSKEDTLRLSYADDDGDEITVSSNREVLDAMGSVQVNKVNKIIKFKLTTEGSGSDGSEPSSPFQSQSIVPMDVPKEQVALENVGILLEDSQMSQLQREVDQRVTGLRREKPPIEERVVVENVFSNFESKIMRQFEVRVNGVACMICPQNKCPKPTTDFSNLRAHGRSEIHQMQLTYQVFGEWFGVNNHSIIPTNRAMDYPYKWRSSEPPTTAQLLAARYHHFSTPTGQRRKRTAFSPATTLALEQFANAINWKRGESEKIAEFAAKHGLTFYQVKVWMNNHRPRRNLNYMTHQYLKSESKSFCQTPDQTREINKIIQALGDGPLPKREAFSLQNLSPLGLPYLTNNSLPMLSKELENHFSAFTSVTSPESMTSISTSRTSSHPHTSVSTEVSSSEDYLKSLIKSEQDSDSYPEYSKSGTESLFSKSGAFSPPKTDLFNSLQGQLKTSDLFNSHYSHVLKSDMPQMVLTSSESLREQAQVIFSNGLLGDNRDVPSIFSNIGGGVVKSEGCIISGSDR